MAGAMYGAKRIPLKWLELRGVVAQLRVDIKLKKTVFPAAELTLISQPVKAPDFIFDGVRKASDVLYQKASVILGAER
ncbi:hypothetical protein NX722_15165 [Endozoicomonas gorgoniicola]|uniref:Uncharacterized protein n=1 Tax=Endozoicomonas gorgoniicola TaxID=1234144 RepID=A0ABT3MX37_9GAMM|nr:hypothetical protein [Endozoicomonas gorgoniicola]MCW7553938.1 hypothetical protein [Endozoicomonas gorgoniicola]